MKYRVLWYDDDFCNESQNYSGMISQLRRLKKFVEKGGHEFEFFQVFQEKDFDAHLSSESHFDAVILDLRGLDLENKTNLDMAKAAMKKLNNIHAQRYVFSATPEDSYFNFEKNTKFNENAIPRENWISKFEREGEGGIENLANKILQDLALADRLYNGFEFVLELRRNNWLSEESKSIIDEIMRLNHNGESIKDYYNAIREQIVKKDVAGRLKDEGIIPADQIDSHAYICNFYRKRGDVKDYEDPYLPYELCGADIKVAIDYLWNMANVGSHLKNASNDPVIEQFVCKQTFYSLLITLKWFWTIMDRTLKKDVSLLAHKESLPDQIKEILGNMEKRETPNPKLDEAVLEYDKLLKAWHCGNCYVNDKVIETNGLNEGDRVVIIARQENMSYKDDIKKAYPFYAKIRKVTQ